MDIETTEEVISQIQKVMPSPFIMKIKRDKEGTKFILRFLYARKDENVFSKDLANFSGLSTARIAAAINTLEENDFIKRCPYSVDKRKTLIKLTEKGVAECDKRKKELIDFCGQIIDKVGLSKMNEYIKLCGELNEAVREVIGKEKRNV